MSKIALSGNASGTGTLTIASQNTNSNYTLTIPNETGTLVTSATTSGISGSAISSGTVAEAYGGTGTNTGYYGFKNRIINGAMMIDQRNAGASVTPANNDYTLDRWKFQLTQSSKVTTQQNAGSVTPPVGFTKYLGVTSTSAYSVVAADQFLVSQYIEGLNVSDLAWGTANAKTITVSAWVYSSLTGTFSGVIQNSAADRCYPFTYTINSANTWQQISATIAGDTTGTWLTTNGAGLRLIFSFGNGSTYAASAGAWTSTQFVTAATGTTSVVGTNGATWYITGVQLEKGSAATSFDYRPYGTELALCQRYYTKFVTDGDIYTFFASGATNSTTNAIVVGQFPVKMRSSPTISASNTRVYDTVSGYATTTIGTNRSSTTSISAEFTISGGTSGRPCFIGANNNTAGYMDASSEL